MENGLFRQSEKELGGGWRPALVQKTSNLNEDLFELFIKDLFIKDLALTAHNNPLKFQPHRPTWVWVFSLSVARPYLNQSGQHFHQT